MRTGSHHIGRRGCPRSCGKDPRPVRADALLRGASIADDGRGPTLPAGFELGHKNLRDFTLRKRLGGLHGEPDRLGHRAEVPKRPRAQHRPIAGPAAVHTGVLGNFRKNHGANDAKIPLFRRAPDGGNIADVEPKAT